MNPLTSEHSEQFAREGLFVVPGLFDSTEVGLLSEITSSILAGGDSQDPHRLDRRDASGLVTKLSLRNELHDDIYSAVVRSPRVAQTMAGLLEDEVYHYHHKVMIKEPRSGGAWEWHQDYGYWYENGCLWPDMASCMVAITAHTRENGCLQVVPGSNRLGRLQHGTVGDQTGADMERVEQVLKRLPVMHLELAQGDGVFFHANLLHRSNPNLSEAPRLSLISCFNTRSNDPYKQHHHPNYSALELGAEQDVAAIGKRQLAQLKAEGNASA